MLLLRLLAGAGRRGASLTDVSRLAHLPHASVHRLLRQLMDERMVVQLDESRRYALGPMCFELGVAAHPYDLRALSRPLLEQLALAADDSVFLSLRSGDESVCIDLEPGPSPVRVVTLEIGTRRPLGAGAGGLAILAALPDDERDEVFERVAPQLERSLHLTRAALRKSMEMLDSEGYALIRNRVHAGVSAVGYPVRGAWGQPIAALSVAGLNERLQTTRLPRVVTQLRQAAQRLERELLGSQSRSLRVAGMPRTLD
jgi:DNA-binding IclR family transcriptional regulator